VKCNHPTDLLGFCNRAACPNSYTKTSDDTDLNNLPIGSYKYRGGEQQYLEFLLREKLAEAQNVIDYIKPLEPVRDMLQESLEIAMELREQNARYRKALAWYADLMRGTQDEMDLKDDCGDRARAALQGEEADE
jgi:hypothetical protein